MFYLKILINLKLIFNFFITNFLIFENPKSAILGIELIIIIF